MPPSKIPLPAFLKVLSNANIPMPKAMAIASKIYKTYNTPAELGKLTDVQLMTLGVEGKEDRKAALIAFKKAGYRPEGAAALAVGGSMVSTSARPSGSSKKRKRANDLNELLPSGPRDEGAALGSFEFEEIMDEESLRTKAAHVNRAPVMTAWALVVAERLSFKREEALSIASAYTEMNAISKGVSLGIFDQREKKGIELSEGQSQPYVDLMGRRIPVYTTQSSEWRALVKGEPVEPASAFAYLTRSFRQTLPSVMGALRLLAASFPPAELNEKGYGLYAEFRPEVDGWGKRAEMRCATILELRKAQLKEEIEGEGADGKAKDSESTEEKRPEENDGEPSSKKAKSISFEEYEAELDATTEYDDLIYNGEF